MVEDEHGAFGSAGGQRRVYQSDPTAPAASIIEEEFERLARQVYLGVRDGVVDDEAVFDLACLLMDQGGPDLALEELAALAAEGTDRDRIAELARQVLAASAFEPGFDVEPGRLAVLEEALDAVRSDMQATALPGPVRLVVPDWSESNAFVDFREGGYGSSNGIPPATRDLVAAMVAVADETQDSVMETLWETWPVCPAHRLGAHAREHGSEAVWWCSGEDGHVIAAIGEWASQSARSLKISGLSGA